MIYFLKAGDYVKIGYTSKDVEQRIASLQTGCPFTIEVLFTMEGTTKDEATLHDMYSDYRRNGEWFELPLHACRKSLVENELKMYNIQKNIENIRKEGSKTLLKMSKGDEAVNIMYQSVEYQKQKESFITKKSTHRSSYIVDDKGVSLTTVRKHWVEVKEDVDQHNLHHYQTEDVNEANKLDVIVRIQDCIKQGAKTKSEVHRQTKLSRVTINKYWGTANVN